MRVNWNPKSQNLREVAHELNIGLDALVHFDDNPMERAEIAANAPQVQLVDVPTDPLGYERALHECGFFDAVAISAEDRQRVRMYREDRARDAIRVSAANVQDYLTGLDMVAEVGVVTEPNLGRVSQLIAKTNQFNLTTRRHTQAEIGRMCSDPGYAVLYIRLRDRFGDLGLIGTGLLALSESEAVIDSLVMSCRAMGRQVEVAMLAELADMARSRGCRTLVGEYRPTARNGVVADLYPQLGFEKQAEDGAGARYQLDLSRSRVEWPSVIRRTETAEVLI
jgi:FkbH-like protein